MNFVLHFPETIIKLTWCDVTMIMGSWRWGQNSRFFYFQINIIKLLYHSFIMLTLRLLLFMIKLYFGKYSFKENGIQHNVYQISKLNHGEIISKIFTKNICCWNTATTPTITALKNPPSDKCCTFWRMELHIYSTLIVILPNNRKCSHTCFWRIWLYHVWTKRPRK